MLQLAGKLYQDLKNIQNMCFTSWPSLPLATDQGVLKKLRELRKVVSVDGIHYSTPIAVPLSHYRKVDQLIRHFVDPPIVRKLQEKTILMVGDLALLTCEVSGVPEPLVKWSKDGDNDITRARLKSNGRILVIENVIPGDRGVYECKASNKFGENRTATTVIVAGKFLKMNC